MKDGAAPKKAKKSAKPYDRNLLGRPPMKLRKEGQSPAERLAELEQQKTASGLIVRGFSMAQIADRLKVDIRTVSRLLARAMDEYLSERDDVVHFRFGVGLSRYDAIISSYMHRALGFKDEKGNVHEPDHKAALVVLRAQRDADRLINYGQSIRVEHTGLGGGPIVTTGATTATMDVRTMIQIVRETIPNAVTPDVILEEGEEIPDGLPTEH
jgi:hypothetical protein